MNNIWIGKERKKTKDIFKKYKHLVTKMTEGV